MRDIITRTLIGILIASSALAAYGQDSPESIVLYDPIFWKDDLKLRSEQCNEIRAVNSEYYEKILDTYEESANDRRELNRALLQCSVERSHQIWQIFSPRQRKKWTKLWHERYTEVRNDG